MTSSNTSLAQASNRLSLGKSAIIGGFIGLAIISVFVFGVDKPDPQWSANWRVKPLLLTPLVATAGGAFFYLANSFNFSGYLKVLAFIAGLLGFVALLWVGVVLGLNGTMWD